MVWPLFCFHICHACHYFNLWTFICSQPTLVVLSWVHTRKKTRTFKWPSFKTRIRTRIDNDKNNKIDKILDSALFLGRYSTFLGLHCNMIAGCVTQAHNQRQQSGHFHFITSSNGLIRMSNTFPIASTLKSYQF